MIDPETAHLRRDDREFLAAISHELRTPLTNIRGFAALLAESSNETQTARYAAIIVRNADHLEQRIRSLLDAAATDTHTPLSRVDLDAVVDDAVASVEERAERRRQRIDVVRPPSTRALVVGDRPQLLLAITELLTNALKFGLDDSRITLSQVDGESGHRIEVYNGGHSVHDSERQRLFERFYRGSNAHANAVQGLGLGLSLVRSIIDRHHGWIDLPDAPDAGFAIRLALPVASD